MFYFTIFIALLIIILLVVSEAFLDIRYGLCALICMLLIVLTLFTFRLYYNSSDDNLIVIPPTDNIVTIDDNYYLKIDDKLLLVNNIKSKGDNGEFYLITESINSKSDLNIHNVDGTQYILDSKNNIVNVTSTTQEQDTNTIETNTNIKEQLS